MSEALRPICGIPGWDWGGKMLGTLPLFTYRNRLPHSSQTLGSVPSLKTRKK